MTGIINEMKKVVFNVINDEQKASEVVHALIKTLGGNKLYMPANDYEKRNKEIKALYKNGATIEGLAKKYRLSDKTIYKIINPRKK